MITENDNNLANIVNNSSLISLVDQSDIRASDELIETKNYLKDLIDKEILSKFPYTKEDNTNNLTILSARDKEEYSLNKWTNFIESELDDLEVLGNLDIQFENALNTIYLYRNVHWNYKSIPGNIQQKIEKKKSEKLMYEEKKTFFSEQLEIVKDKEICGNLPAVYLNNTILKDKEIKEYTSEISKLENNIEKSIEEIASLSLEFSEAYRKVKIKDLDRAEIEDVNLPYLESITSALRTKAFTIIDKNIGKYTVQSETGFLQADNL